MMSGFGIRKNNTGKAIIRFLVGLLIVAVCVLLMYEFVLNGDFQNETPDNNYAALNATAQPTETDHVGDENRPEIIRDSKKPTVATEIEATVEEPDPVATPVPTPVPTPTPTPAPTPIPAESLSKEVSTFGGRGTSFSRTGFKTNGSKINVGLTDFEVSAGDGGKAITLTGWAYAEDEKFDGAKSDIYVVVLNSKQQVIFYAPAIVSGVTGNVMEGMGKNLDQCEFTAAIDVSWYPGDDYQIGAGVVYKVGSKQYKYALTFGDAYKFTIVNGVVSAVGGKEVS